MLIATINHNLPELTDNLVSQINSSIRGKDELLVLDNGSEIQNRAKSTTHYLDTNVFFGGGFNVILDYFLNETTQDYLFVLNNDLIFHGHNLIQTIEDRINQFNLDVYSPSIINASISQCHWKQMYNWNSDTIRYVDWIDFQAPVLSRRLLEMIVQYPSELIYGWGLDFFTGIITQRNNMNTGVDDRMTFTHLDGQTFKQNKINIGINEFCMNAERNMNNFFYSSDMQNEYMQLRTYGENYKHE